MTTKQEIIDFIENKLHVMKVTKVGDMVVASKFASKELIQMIKELKPTVKKLELGNFVDFKNLTQDIETFKKHYEQTILGALEDE